jgi:hypothetical protein
MLTNAGDCFFNCFFLQRIAIVANIRIDHKESEEKLFKLVVRKHSDGDTIVRHFNPVLVTDEHFIIFCFLLSFKLQIIVLNIEANIEYILGFFKAILVKMLTNAGDCFFKC